jgi:hypothetical protein
MGNSEKNGSPRKVIVAFVLLLGALATHIVPARVNRGAANERGETWRLPAAEFSRLITELSEEDGYFSSDNLVSNETSYLHVAGPLREMKVGGGAYIGVGPEQNFSYISLLKPEIAFILDIRRQAMIQQLLYKAIFHASPDRAAFLSNLLSRPRGGSKAPAGDASAQVLVQYFEPLPPSDGLFKTNLTRFTRAIEEDFRVPLSEQDRLRLQKVYSAFHSEGLGLAFRTFAAPWGGGYGVFPTLKDLILERDLDGNPGNFLATHESYKVVRDLQLANRIIPIVGDFAGTKALAGIGSYLQRNRHVLRAFYTSNVEQFLFRNRVFPKFVANLRTLPTDDRSVLIRSVPGRGFYHPANIPGHRLTTILQLVPVFLNDYDAGEYVDYWTMVSTHYIAGEKH